MKTVCVYAPPTNTFARRTNVPTCVLRVILFEVVPETINVIAIRSEFIESDDANSER